MAEMEWELAESEFFHNFEGSVRPIWQANKEEPSLTSPFLNVADDDGSRFARRGGSATALCSWISGLDSTAGADGSSLVGRDTDFRKGTMFSPTCRSIIKEGADAQSC
jgi:hypothetical protein